MNENQVQEENLFEDYEDTTSEVETAEETADETTEESVDEADGTEAAPFLKVTYDKEERDLSEDEAREFAQKGMNYDRMKGKYDELNSRLDHLAKLNGMSVDEYLNALGDTQREYMVDTELEKLKEQYPNDSEEVLKEIAQRRVNENLGNSQREQQGRADALDAEMKRQLDMFQSEYPDVEVDKLDPSVLDYIRQGYTLLEAYTKYDRIQRMKEQPKIDAKQKAEKLNEENRKKSLGNTGNAGKVESDDFLNGFLNG